MDDISESAPRGVEGSDIYSTAIRRLHISVLPGTLPCRTKEKETIIAYLRDGIMKQGHVRPLYISGMPGTGIYLYICYECTSCKLKGFNQ